MIRRGRGFGDMDNLPPEMPNRALWGLVSSNVNLRSEDDTKDLIAELRRELEHGAISGHLVVPA